ncbi:MAG: hypothetical protein V7L31_16040 [Nostoc sp.]|uniref:hypothetical protein n=1 Tax=Nostoc sp. TaxID=1180 RepID=UPI002FEEC9E0
MYISKLSRVEVDKFHQWQKMAIAAIATIQIKVPNPYLVATVAVKNTKLVDSTLKL